LGFEFPDDEDLLWIAEEGLKAPVPEPWQAFTKGNDEIYYFNMSTGEEQDDHPLDGYYKDLVMKYKMEKQRQKQMAMN